MLFMKGDPLEAKCGFSRTIVGLLQEHDIAFGSVVTCVGVSSVCAGGWVVCVRACV